MFTSPDGKAMLHLRLVVDVTYELNGTDPGALEHYLGSIPEHYANHGAFTDETEAVVEEWDASIEEIKPDTVNPAPQMVTPVVGPDAGKQFVARKLSNGDNYLEVVKSASPDRWNVVVFQDKDDEEYMASGHMSSLGDAQIMGMQAFTSLQSPLASLTDNTDEEFIGEATTLQGWDEIVKKAVAKLQSKSPAFNSLNGKKCDDGGCPGWGVFYRDGSGTFEIEKCDNCGRFEYDDDALSYVYLLESSDIARHLLHNREPFHEWLKNEVQMVRLLGELYAHMELSEDSETMQEPGYLSVKINDLCASMDLSWARILELFKRADLLYEEDKRKTLEEPHDAGI